MLVPMTWPCLLAWVPSGMCRVRPDTRSRTSTQSPPAQMLAWPRTRMARAGSGPPDPQSRSAAARASAGARGLGGHPEAEDAQLGRVFAGLGAPPAPPTVLVGQHLGALRAGHGVDA